jgi:hypothetical protein
VDKQIYGETGAKKVYVIGLVLKPEVLEIDYGIGVNFS